MKATLEFNLPEDKAEHDLAINGPKYFSLLVAFTDILRQKTKYEDSPKTDWQKVCDMWWQLLNEEGVDPYGD